MTQYRYLATNLISGQVLADTIPLDVQSFGMQLNGSGTLTGSLDLQQNYPLNQPFISALECRRAVIWALADNYPVWAGVVWDWPDMSRSNGTLPISAQTIDSVFSHRLITDTLNYPQVDLFQVFIDLCVYGQTKMSNYISSISPAVTRSPAYLAMVAKTGGIANLNMPSGAAAISGVPWTASHTYSDLSQVSSEWSNMCASGNLEYVFAPGLDSSGNLAIFLRLAYQQLGRPLGQAGYTLQYPGQILDYGYQRTGSQSGNLVWATAPPNGAALQWQSVYPHGADLPDLNAGYPLMESTVSWQGSVVTSQAQVNAFADGHVALVTAGMATPTVTIGGGGYPALKDIVLGDATTFVATSPLHPPRSDGTPGLQQQVRITGWTCTPPGPQTSESIQLTTSGVVSSL